MSFVKDTFFGGAEKKAGKTEARAQEAGIEEQRRQFDVTQGNLLPFQEAGVEALGQQRALMGLGTPEEQQQAFAAFDESPGQKFMRDRAQRNLVRNSSAIGGLGGGNVRSALVEQGAGFAQQDFQNQFGRLGQMAGQGQSAVTNLGQFGAQAAGNIQQGLIGAGQARASGIIGQAAGRRAGFQMLAGAAAGGAGGGGAMGALQGGFGV